MTIPGQSGKPANPRFVAASLLLHAGVLALVLHHPTRLVAPMRLPGTHLGSHIELTYSPGRAPVQTSVPNPHNKSQPEVAALKPQPALPTPRPVQPAPTSPNTSSPSTSQPDVVSGADALGDGDVSIALVTFFPRPKPDLSPLPHGTAGDVILDVVIDSDGKISDIKVAHSLSPTIDQTVIATVQQWTFHPAVKDGQPIASEQELHFHYERG